MDFALTSEQALIKESVERFVADSYGFDRRTALAASDEGFSRENWSTFAELGWLGIAFPEDRGGYGGTPLETMLLMEVFGTGLVLEPFVPTVVLGGTALAYGETSRARELLDEVIAGDRLLTLAYAEERSRYDYRFIETRARREGSDLIVTGEKRGVPYAAAAETYVVSVRTEGATDDEDGITLVLIDRDAAGVSRDDYRTIDSGRASDITFESVRVPAGNVLAEIGNGLPLLERVLDTGVGALCAEAVGILSVMQRTTLEYLKTREQFGVPIGSFQVLQHRAVDMLMELEFARSMCLYGTVALANESSAAERKHSISATKVQVSRSGRSVGQAAIQLHGGIGMSEEYMIGHYFKRMTAIELALGDTDFHLRRYIGANVIAPREELLLGVPT